MLYKLLLAFSLLTLLPGCPSSVETEPQPQPQQHDDGFLQPSSFHLPEEGTPNDNGPIGPFCCTGVTAIVQTTGGYAAGYVYFFDWEGQAVTDGHTSFAPDVKILLAGLVDAHDPQSGLMTDEIVWDAAEMKLVPAKSARVGQLQFTVTIERVNFVSLSESELFDMGTFAVRADVALVD
jgi:hypothetical protein